MKCALPIIAVFIFSGCATTRFVKTGDYTSQPREENCNFTIYTSPPASFKEIGLIHFYTGTGNTVYTLDGIKSTSQKYVCAAGGNGIILPPPKDGIYEQATVIWTKH